MIHVIATVELNPGSRDKFLAEFHKIVTPVRAEAGCIEYGPTIDVASGLAAQPALRPDVVVVVEKWASLDALMAHTQAPHMQQYRERVKDFVRSVKLLVLEPA